MMGAPSLSPHWEGFIRQPLKAITFYYLVLEQNQVFKPDGAVHHEAISCLNNLGWGRGQPTQCRRVTESLLRRVRFLYLPPVAHFKIPQVTEKVAKKAP